MGWITLEQTPKAKAVEPKVGPDPLSGTVESRKPSKGDTSGPWGAPTTSDPQDWRDYFEETAATYEAGHGYERVASECAAYSTALSAAYYYRHKPDPDRCGGCGEALGADAITYGIAGQPVHIRDDYACFRVFGDKWRAAAAGLLEAMEIECPPDYEVWQAKPNSERKRNP